MVWPFCCVFVRADGFAIYLGLRSFAALRMTGSDGGLLGGLVIAICVGWRGCHDPSAA